MVWSSVDSLPVWWLPFRSLGWTLLLIVALPGLAAYLSVSYTHLDVYKRQARGRAASHNGAAWLRRGAMMMGLAAGAHAGAQTAGPAGTATLAPVTVRGEQVGVTEGSASYTCLLYTSRCV